MIKRYAFTPKELLRSPSGYATAHVNSRVLNVSNDLPPSSVHSRSAFAPIFSLLDVTPRARRLDSTYYRIAASRPTSLIIYLKIFKISINKIILFLFGESTELHQCNTSTICFKFSPQSN